MNATFVCFASIAFLGWIGTSSALHAQRDSGQILTYLRTADEKQKLIPYRGTVERIEALGDGKSMVHFKAAKADVDKEGATIGVSKDFRRTWPHADRPVPFVGGQHVLLAVNPEGKPAQVFYNAGLVQLRFRPDGDVELAMRPTAGPKALLLLHPQRVGALSIEDEVEVIWDLQYGLVVTVTAAGPGEIEVEALTKRAPGIPFSNKSDRSLTPGRDGWHRPANGDVQRIPDRQYTLPAG